MQRIICTTFLTLLVSCAFTSTAGADDIEIEGAFITNQASGPPLEVGSSERVFNLNADMVDGLDATAFEPASQANETHTGASIGDYILLESFPIPETSDPADSCETLRIQTNNTTQSFRRVFPDMKRDTEAFRVPKGKAFVIMDVFSGRWFDPDFWNLYFVPGPQPPYAPGDNLEAVRLTGPAVSFAGGLVVGETVHLCADSLDSLWKVRISGYLIDLEPPPS